MSKPPPVYFSDVRKVTIPNGIVTIKEIGYFKSESTLNNVIVPIDTCNNLPKLIKKVIPDYSPILRIAHIVGPQKFMVWVAAGGNVIKARYEGNEDSYFIKSSINAIREFQYSTYLENCIPKEFVSIILIDYQIEKTVH